MVDCEEMFDPKKDYNSSYQVSDERVERMQVNEIKRQRKMCREIE